MGFFDVIFEGDTAQVISDINSSPLYISRIGHFYDSIHVEKQFLRLCSFIFILREANFAVYSLTKEAACHKTNLCWQEDIPNNITSIILGEAGIPRILFVGSSCLHGFWFNEEAKFLLKKK
jgi:hypothetical protein